MNRLKKGDRWAHMTCTRVWKKPIIDEAVYDSDPPTDWMYTLTCDCGTVVEMKEYEFRGKRRTPDCGCLMMNRDIRQVIAFSLPQSMINDINIYVRDKDVNKSTAAEMLIGKGLKEEGYGHA